MAKNRNEGGTVAKRQVRKPHIKSRKGCGNCKLRGIKCDESKPQCQKCRQYGVLCNYDQSKGDPGLQIAHGIEVTVSLSTGPASALNLDKASAERLRWFRWAQTSLTILNVPQDEILRMACEHPFLMHVVLTLSAMHQRHLSPAGSETPTTFELYHTSKCIKLLNQKIAQPIPPEHRDAVWMAATFLGIVVFSATSTTTPESVWPLQTGPADLEWARMTMNKISIWNLANPLRPDSLFHSMTNEYMEMFKPVTPRAVFGASESIMQLCHLDGSSTRENNPYFTAAHTLLPLLGRCPQEIPRSNVLSFTSQMVPNFANLLHERDPIALLLLALWYGIARRVIWWSRVRATVELQSISAYLQQRYPEWNAIQRVLLWPDGLSPDVSFSELRETSPVIL